MAGGLSCEELTGQRPPTFTYPGRTAFQGTSSSSRRVVPVSLHPREPLPAGAGSLWTPVSTLAVPPRSEPGLLTKSGVLEDFAAFGFGWREAAELKFQIGGCRFEFGCSRPGLADEGWEHGEEERAGAVCHRPSRLWRREGSSRELEG